MASLPVIANCYRVALNWVHSSGQHAENVMHFRRLASTAAAVAALVDANVTANMWNQLSSGAVVTSIDVTPLDGSSATVRLATSGAKWTGSDAGDFLVAPAALVSLRTGVRGRSYRGRVYRPFPGEVSVSNGVLSAGGVTASQTAWTTFVAAMNTASCQLVVASYLHQTTADVTTAIVENVLATIRRRQTRLR